MKIGVLLKYSLYLLLIILITFLILTTYLYFFSNKPSIEIAYYFIVPICMFIISFLYSRNIHERGLVRGLEIWIIYMGIILLLKLVFQFAFESNILQHIIYLPISILGGVIGVNIKK
ncbi:TIGR04086 family membrane protein [Sedimentibacter sp. MB31-C6]|uniref:TIGR04086 family membrane protein n=1 Tax=Sedimentibacter sp. MB31-C6 TaxID=3109366 RepID=UPI002DDDB108|nr:TIGR04086 family membrane protein [Sedimentibacter sp. MB36-C1]WSI04480.1 TIGR04086 family membrane protein [Sedimentibacter sp. MB36-C1]